MMNLSPKTAHQLLVDSSEQAWSVVREHLEELFFAELSENHEIEEILRREKALLPLELFLSGPAWTLWKDFIDVVPRSSQKMIDWWHSGFGSKAVLVLDGLSAREMPILMHEATKRGFSLGQSNLYGSELPAETNAYAKALGFSHRGALDNNGASSTHKLGGAHTLTNQLPWLDLAASIPNVNQLMIWHEWPDHRLHDLSDHGQGIRPLLSETVRHLKSDDFWLLIKKLATGRELLITSDHGYADTGSFRDAEQEEKNYLRENFGGARCRQDDLSHHEWLPPLAITLDCPTGRWSLALGRTKWAVAGGNRTLSHGGLSLLETFVPFLTINPS